MRVRRHIAAERTGSDSAAADLPGSGPGRGPRLPQPAAAGPFRSTAFRTGVAGRPGCSRTCAGARPNPGDARPRPATFAGGFAMPPFATVMSATVMSATVMPVADTAGRPGAGLGFDNGNFAANVQSQSGSPRIGYRF